MDENGPLMPPNDFLLPSASERMPLDVDPPPAALRSLTNPRPSGGKAVPDNSSLAEAILRTGLWSPSTTMMRRKYAIGSWSRCAQWGLPMSNNTPNGQRFP